MDYFNDYDFMTIPDVNNTNQNWLQIEDLAFMDSLVHGNVGIPIPIPIPIKEKEEIEKKKFELPEEDDIFRGYFGSFLRTLQEPEEEEEEDGN